MPEGEVLFTVKAPLQKVWDFLSDMKNVGSCIPNCEVNVIDSETSEWYITEKIGFISKTFSLKTRTTKIIAPKHAAWIGEGENIEMSGSLDLTPISNEETEVRLKLSLNASGPLKAIINNVIASKMDDYKNAFMNCVKSKLESVKS